MKKIFISLLFMATPVFLFAQLKVFSNGFVTINHPIQTPYANLTVKNTYTNLST